MTGRQLGGFALGVCLFLIAPQLALAQTTVSLSYDPLLHELTEDSVVGGHASIAKSFGAVAAVGEVGANHFDQATVLTLAPGFRYGIRTGGHSRISPSVQAVVGLWHCGACAV